MTVWIFVSTILYILFSSELIYFVRGKFFNISYNTYIELSNHRARVFYKILPDISGFSQSVEKLEYFDYTKSHPLIYIYILDLNI